MRCLENVNMDEKLVNSCISADIDKLHSEINQLVNQRFLLTAGSITVFALVARHIITIHAEPIYYLSNCAIYLCLVLVLGLLYYQSRRLRTTIRIYSTYLVACNYSDWELHWRIFRNNSDTRRIAKSDLSAHTLIFKGLSFAAIAFGLLLLAYLLHNRVGALFQLLWLAAFLSNIALVFNIYENGFNPDQNEEELIRQWKVSIRDNKQGHIEYK